MSTEVVKKRGRPKKAAVPELVEVELPALVKAATKTKSTKAVPKAVSTKTFTPPKTPVAKKPISQTASAPKTHPSNSALPIKAKTETPLQLEKKPPIEASQLKAKSGVIKNTGEAAAAQMSNPSPILAEVQKLKEKNNMAAESPRPNINLAVSSVPTPNTSGIPNASTPGAPVKQAGVESSTPKSSGTPPKCILEKKTAPGPSSTPPSTKPPPSKPAGKPHVPLAQLNSDIVSNITTRAGARPNTEGSKQLPKNYKTVSRKVTMAIVALPIAIVTSYVLYQRCRFRF